MTEMRGKSGGKGIKIQGKHTTKKEAEPESVKKPEAPKVPEPTVTLAPEATTKLVKCTCVNKWQDKTYGKGMRVHNKMAMDRGWRCTVCATAKLTGGSSK